MNSWAQVWRSLQSYLAAQPHRTSPPSSGRLNFRVPPVPTVPKPAHMMTPTTPATARLYRVVLLKKTPNFRQGLMTNTQENAFSPHFYLNPLPAEPAI